MCNVLLPGGRNDQAYMLSTITASQRKMVKSCCAVGCSNRCIPGSRLSFYRFPTDPARKSLWITKINRKNWAPNDNSRVCSAHFIKGVKSDDPLSPDYVPTVFDHTTCSEKEQVKVQFTAYERRKENRRKRRENFNPLLAKRRVRHKSKQNEGTMTDTTVESVTSLERENSEIRCKYQMLTDQYQELSKKHQQLAEEYQNLEDKYCMLSEEYQKCQDDKALLKSQCDRVAMTKEHLRDDDKKVKFYTGLPSYTVLLAVFNLIAPRITDHQRHTITKFQQFMMVLVKLRLNLTEVDLGYRFGIDQSTVSRLFEKWINVMFAALSPLVKWPKRTEVRKTMPVDFRKNFRRCVAIIDCFEVFCERPAGLKARAQTWSNYKHHNTIKFLIGIAPQGAIIFISKGWGGRVSDQYLTEHSGLLEHLLPGDQILADRGFNVQDSARLYCAEVKTPPFTRGKKQLSKIEVDQSRALSRVRIHVERVIGVLRQKYTILQGTLPIKMLMTHSSDGYSSIDKVVNVCSALCNCCESVVPFE